jgi:hypothetical protein
MLQLSPLVQTGDDDVVLRGRDYALTPLYDPTSAETYYEYDTRQKKQVQLTEALSFIWSCSPACTLSQSVSYVGDVPVVTTPSDGDASRRFTVQLVLRDSRGGEAVYVKTFTLLPSYEIP